MLDEEMPPMPAVSISEDDPAVAELEREIMALLQEKRTSPCLCHRLADAAYDVSGRRESVHTSTPQCMSWDLGDVVLGRVARFACRCYDFNSCAQSKPR